MLPHPKTQNDLIRNFLNGPKLAEYADFEVAEFYSGRFDQPVQVALRNCATQRIELVDLNRDGTVGYKIPH